MIETIYVVRCDATDMTDLLGLLNALHTAVAAAGELRIVHKSLEGNLGAVDHETDTVYIEPDLSPDEWLATLAEGVRVLNASRRDLFGVETFGPMTADGGQVIPMWPKLRLVGDA